MGDTIYVIFMTLHNITRWAVVILGALAIYRAVRGWRTRSEWGKADDQAGIWYTSIIDTQFLLGLILYFLLSPITKQVFTNFGDAMKVTDLRYFGIEHLFIMVIALALAHMGRVFTKKAVSALQKHQAALLWYGLSLAIILVGIPWWRPLLRFFN